MWHYIRKGERNLKKLIAVIVTWVFLVAIVVAAPVSATEIIYSDGGASPEMIEACQPFTGHCSSPFGK